MKIPKKITPSPINEVAIEIRFEPNLPSDAVFGVLYEKLKNEYSKIENLPILQLPEVVRGADPNLKYKPHYRLLKDNFAFHVGPHLIALNYSVKEGKEYIGWTAFYTEMCKILDNISGLSVFKKVDRLAVRYINFFDSHDIFKKVNFEIKVPFSHPQKNTFLGTELQIDKFLSRLQIADDVSVTRNNQTKKGSIIDIDVFVENLGTVQISDLKSKIGEAHICAEEIFFKTLSQSFLKSLKPEYNEKK